MELEKIKSALPEDLWKELDQHITTLIGQRDTARAESVDHRKGLKAKLETLEKTQSELFERLGIESVEELNDIDPKGQAEAAKQFEARVKRLERELEAERKTAAELQARHKATLRDAAMRRALANHEFQDIETVEALISSKLEWDEDTLLYRAGKNLIPLDEGLKLIAQEKPFLVKTHGAGGSGYRKPVNGDAGQRNPWTKGQYNLTEQMKMTLENPQLAAQLKQQAAAQV